jgi:hypothetical protein
MDQIVGFISNNWGTILIIVAACGGVDAIAGFFPDKWLPYVGIIRRLVILAAKKGGAIPVFIMLVLPIFIGCAANSQFPDCNKSYPQDAFITKIAIDHHLCLRDIGTGLIVANGINISLAKLYTADQALTAVDGWLTFLGGDNITDSALLALISNDIKNFPELIEITEVFRSQFNTGTILDDGSIGIISKYLKDRVRPILISRISTGG